MSNAAVSNMDVPYPHGPGRRSNAYHVAAVGKGWWDQYRTTPSGRLILNHDQVLAKVALIFSELVEADEESPDKPTRYTESGKPEGYFIELADTYIRILDLLGALGWVCSGDKTSVDLDGTITARWLGRAIEAIRVADLSDPDGEPDAPLAEAREFLWRAACGLWSTPGVPEAVKVKHAYNHTRAYRHGGKKA